MQIVPSIVCTLIVTGGCGIFPKVIPANTTVITKAAITNLFCFSIWDIKDHFMEVSVVNETGESRNGFMPDINIFQSSIVQDRIEFTDNGIMPNRCTVERFVLVLSDEDIYL